MSSRKGLDLFPARLYKWIENFARAIPGSAKQRIEKNVIFSILQNQMLITFDFGGASLCHEILHFVQKSRINRWFTIA
uniref:Uncharacterized protein n=1 Tax=Candidatus Kentrum sp. LPFa TaxID=2126335 RepID=A0A450WUE5_9GAMM|nr:MAG: hypothetical protein BECKLPF1236A_GA0070988_102716 [Candidatus Kentron sp. LPFa]